MADVIHRFEEACVDVIINVSDSDFPVQVPRRHLAQLQCCSS